MPMDPLGAQLAQLFRSLQEGVAIGHADARVPFELAEAALVESFFHDRVVGIGQHNVAALLEQAGLLQVANLDLTADVLGSRCPWLPAPTSSPRL
jgi:hypothetical protein